MEIQGGLRRTDRAPHRGLGFRALPARLLALHRAHAARARPDALARPAPDPADAGIGTAQCVRHNAPRKATYDYYEPRPPPLPARPSAHAPGVSAAPEPGTRPAHLRQA